MQSATSILPLLHRTISRTRPLTLIQSLLQTEIKNNFNAFHQTTNTLAAAFHDAGAKTELYQAPTGGNLGSGEWLIHEAQDVTHASLSITHPFTEKLADFNDSPFHAIQWTAATPPEGLTAQLQIVESLDHLQTLKPRHLQNKILLTKINLYDHAHLLARHNPAAVIFESNIKNCPDAIAWTKFGWGGIPLARGPMRLPGMVLSHNQSQKLREKLANHPDLQLHSNIQTNRYPGTHDVLSALIEGEDDPQSEIWAIAHSAEPGALDNASGVAALVEIAHTLNHLIATNQLARPKRTIRLVAAYECYGFFHYLIHHKRFTPPLAGLCLDTLGAKPEFCDQHLRLHATLPASAGYVDHIAEQCLTAAIQLDNPGYIFESLPFISTEDTLIADPLHGFPCPWITNHPCTAYHSSADTLDKLDPRGHATITAASAAYLYHLANMATEEALALAQQETTRAVNQVRSTGRVPCSADQVAPATPLSMPDVSSHSNCTLSHPNYIRARHQSSLTNLKKFLWTGTHEDLANKFQSLESQLNSAISASMSQLPMTNDQLPTPASLIPLRKRPLTPTAENVFPPHNTHLAHRKWTLYWANGNRSIAEIHQLLNHEPNITKPVPLDELIQYFQNLAAINYVQLLHPKELLTRDQLLQDLRALGLTPNMDLIVHSSLSAVGPIQNGPNTLIDAILEAIAPNGTLPGGTLLVPSFNHFAAKLYNPLATPARNGARPDARGRRPDAKRSLHGSHPLAAIGPKADHYLHNHLEAGIWSMESPIGRLIQNDGYILSLGVTHDTSTAYHVAEVAANAPCIHQFSNSDNILLDGHPQKSPGLAWRNGDCPVPTDQLDTALDQQNLQRHGQVGQAKSTLARAKDIFTLRQQHIKPHCPTCPIRPDPR
jgi:aminoglycoside 3-N-acetyltransferase